MPIIGSYQITTPLYLGGANHAPEFRLASYVHMLRWWWRFLALSRFDSAECAAYWEAMLFGWPSDNFGVKRISFRLLMLDETSYPLCWETNNNKFGINYLNAQSISQRNPVKARSFEVEARINEKTIDVGKEIDIKLWQLTKNTLVDAMALMGLLGGLGARSRRGFGSLAVTGLINDDESVISALPPDIAGYKKQLARHLGAVRYDGQPAYSALSTEFTYEICASANDAYELMNDISWAFQIYRSYGQKNKNGGHFHKKSNNNKTQLRAGSGKDEWYNCAFKADHDNFYGKCFDGESFDNRAVFGLPHNYGEIKVGWDTQSSEESNGKVSYRRRASPLLFHFHPVGEKIVFVASVIPAQFAPKCAYLSVNKKLLKKDKTKIASNINFNLAKGFADFIRDPDATGQGKGVQHTTFDTVAATEGKP